MLGEVLYPSTRDQVGKQGTYSCSCSGYSYFILVFQYLPVFIPFCLYASCAVSRDGFQIVNPVVSSFLLPFESRARADSVVPPSLFVGYSRHAATAAWAREDILRCRFHPWALIACKGAHGIGILPPLNVQIPSGLSQ